uniref:RNase_Zc3h12a domain-containing protein n=1 Tax=Anopheles melas TaxID=34690 RepID=A0A182UA08_9DIPT
MARTRAGKKQQSNGPAQPPRNTKKEKPSTFKAKRKPKKKPTNQLAQTFASIDTRQANMSPGKMSKSMKRSSKENLRRLSAIVEKRRKQQDAVQLQNMPVAANPQNGGIKENNQQKSAPDTIVIEDSDEESEPTGTGGDAVENASTDPLFYVDRNPGIREEDVPLYVVGSDVEEQSASTKDGGPKQQQPSSVSIEPDHRQSATIEPDECSVIVLDSTFDQTMNNSMKDMKINAAECVQPITVDTAEPCTSSSSTSTNTSATNVQTKKKIRSNSQAAETIVTDVIDLSDYPDTEQQPSCSSYAGSNTKTPAFPTLDRIPLGYSASNAARAKPKRPPQKPHTQGSGSGSGGGSGKGGGDGGKATNTNDVVIGSALHVENKMKRMVIIDGNNVAYGHLNGKMFSVKGLELCINYFKKLGFEVTAVVPQFKLKRHQSTDQALLEQMHRNGDVTLAPCKSLPGQCSSSYDDRLILSIAEQFDGVIISNDNFRDLLDISPEWRRIIETRVVGYSWVKDCFFLPDDPYGRYGPTLQQILYRTSH